MNFWLETAGGEVGKGLQYNFLPDSDILDQYEGSRDANFNWLWMQFSGCSEERFWFTCFMTAAPNTISQYCRDLNETHAEYITLSHSFIIFYGIWGIY